MLLRPPGPVVKRIRDTGGMTGTRALRSLPSPRWFLRRVLPMLLALPLLGWGVAVSAPQVVDRTAFLLGLGEEVMVHVTASSKVDSLGRPEPGMGYFEKDGQLYTVAVPHPAEEGERIHARLPLVGSETKPFREDSQVGGGLLGYLVLLVVSGGLFVFCLLGVVANLLTEFSRSFAQQVVLAQRVEGTGLVGRFEQTRRIRLLVRRLREYRR